MCEHGDTTKVWVHVPAELSHLGYAYNKEADVDRCIAPLVEAINDGLGRTVASCCGHGKRPGSIALADGRELRIMTYEQARAVDGLFPPITPTQENET